MGEFVITVDGKTVDEVLDAIMDWRAGRDPMRWGRLRLASGKLREPVKMLAPRGDYLEDDDWVLVDEVPAGATLWGVPVANG
jgi:hypothetical protein